MISASNLFLYKRQLFPSTYIIIALRLCFLFLNSFLIVFIIFWKEHDEICLKNPLLNAHIIL